MCVCIHVCLFSFIYHSFLRCKTIKILWPKKSGFWPILEVEIKIMEQKQDSSSCLVVWRGQKFIIEISPSATLKELGKKLQDLTHADTDTIRLLVPMEKSSKLLYPFSDEHANLSLDATLVLKGKPVKMMGVPTDEVDEVIRNAKTDLRIAGFDEEERRLKQRRANKLYPSSKLPKGTYIFCDFQTLSLPGIELNPPASKALELLHKLASDPGIVAIMNKHRWRVGILTEMAPIGYVGVSPKCILGFNKNQGEEISLRLRTDDLKGFRKYEIIKKTLLHELAHMVFSEHNSDFYALDKQLNKEASALDWTKSTGHTLNSLAHTGGRDEEFDITSNVTSSQMLGGLASLLPNARASSVNAAFQRLANATPPLSRTSEELITSEFEHQDCEGDDSMAVDLSMEHHNLKGFIGQSSSEELQRVATMSSGEGPSSQRIQDIVGPDQMNSFKPTSLESSTHVDSSGNEPHADDLHAVEIPNSHSTEATPMSPFEPYLSAAELQIIQDPVTEFYGRLQSSIKTLKNEMRPSEIGVVLQTLMKIICNVVENPDEIKFKRLRKANPMIQRNIMAYGAALDILMLVGFCEDTIIDEWGKVEAFLMLKRNDPGLLWLAKSSLETQMT